MIAQKYTPDLLRAFSEEIAADYSAGLIRHPIHLDGGNEAALIETFETIGPHDWVCGAWRMHHCCLLKGVPLDELKAAIYAGKSIALCFPEYRIISSAIVGGILPIAVGIALGLQRTLRNRVKDSINAEIGLGALRRDENSAGRIEDAIAHAFDPGTPRVHVIVGDMTARTGAFYEATRYAVGHGLPIRFIIFDNGKSVLTDTVEAWGSPAVASGSGQAREIVVRQPEIIRHRYTPVWPHSGIGRRVDF